MVAKRLVVVAEVVVLFPVINERKLDAVVEVAMILPVRNWP